MQFKHPELLWALFLLLIPIIIHLFQLRRFQKTPFTNVKFLKKVVSESRRSNVLKKWLLLCTRFLLLAALVVAFAQPFLAKQSALMEKEIVIYLDDSFSMQARLDGTTLLEQAVQSLIKSLPKKQVFTLFTNEKVFRQVTLPEVQNELLAIEPTPKQLLLKEVFLKGNTFFQGDSGTLKHLVVLTDFQRRMGPTEIDTTNTVQEHFVPMTVANMTNVSLDSIYTDGGNSDNIELTALVSRTGSIENTPVSLFNGSRLIAKTAAVFLENDEAKVQFTLPKNEVINGKLEVSDTGLAYDNTLYFTIDKKEKIKVLSIGNANSNYLKKIYTEDEFSFTDTAPQTLNYSDLDTQNLIVLNGLPTVPTALINGLKSFMSGGGSLVVVPTIDLNIDSYNTLVSNAFSTSFTQKMISKRAVSNISFAHPLYRNVFERNITNFQFPEVSQYYRIKTTLSTALSFQDNAPFLIGGNGKYLFTSSISSENSNFQNSPLIVPTFYNMGINSLKLPPLYGILGNDLSLDVSAILPVDNILKIKKGDYEFIPGQQAFANKVTLAFDGNLKQDGIYTVLQGDTSLKNISFNYDRKESDLTYLDLNELTEISKSSSIASLFDNLEKDNRITDLWKWFVILALLMLLSEILIQKYI